MKYCDLKTGWLQEETLRMLKKLFKVHLSDIRAVSADFVEVIVEEILS